MSRKKEEKQTDKKAEPNTKYKGISFNLEDDIEKWMWDEAEKMRQNNVSFAGTMKRLFQAYLMSKGKFPPGFQFLAGQQQPELPAVAHVEMSSEEDHFEDIVEKMPFSLDDED